MAAGDYAKQTILNKICEALGDCYLGCQDKKYYFMSEENGVEKQVAITLTCPKTGIEATPNHMVKNDGIDFESNIKPVAPTIEISDEERRNIEEMMKRLKL